CAASSRSTPAYPKMCPRASGHRRSTCTSASIGAAEAALNRGNGSVEVGTDQENSMKHSLRLLLASTLAAVVTAPAVAHEAGTWVLRAGVGTIQPKHDSLRLG